MIELNETLEILGDFAHKFSPDSQEHLAILRAIDAICFLQDIETRHQFESYVKKKNSPLTGFDILNMKFYGLDIPEEFRDQCVVALESEIDLLVSKIQKFPPVQ